MKLMLDIDIPVPGRKITYNDHILLVGSCFTGNVGKSLQEARFNTLYNTTGILFDPHSAARHLHDLLDRRTYKKEDVFHFNELWSSWQHHSEFSSPDRDSMLRKLNTAVQAGADFLNRSNWLIITFGTAFSYRLVENNVSVANCHKAPSSLFNKHLLDADEICGTFEPLLDRLFTSNEQLNVIFTISPVRHVRDGVIENSRSKARLVEAVHRMTDRYERCIYFPSYELVIDVLRDYRFYDADLVHPNPTATQFVFESFCKHYMDENTRGLMDEVRKIALARSHRPQHPETKQHKQFLETHLQKTKELELKLPMLDWKAELEYFSKGCNG